MLLIYVNQQLSSFFFNRLPNPIWKGLFRSRTGPPLSGATEPVGRREVGRPYDRSFQEGIERA